MIDKVIIAEDHEFANLSVQKTMDDLKIKQFDHAFYCDDAFAKIAGAKKLGKPYDLLITDLGFEEDGKAQQIKNGYELIQRVRELQPEILIVVLSAEHHPAAIDKLYTTYHINAYVRKARHDARELKQALNELSKGQSYYPRSLAQQVKQYNSYEFTQFDISIIRLLSLGYQQKDISIYLKEKNQTPSSLSSIEKRLKQIRDELGFVKNEQLVLFCKEAGVL